MRDNIYNINIFDKKICESVNIKIEALKVGNYFVVVYTDKECNVFNKQRIESNRYVLKEQVSFELMMHFRKCAELILKKNYR